MSLIELVVLFVVGLQPNWRPDYCSSIEMNVKTCMDRQEKGYEVAKQLAQYFVEEGERQDLDPFWLAAVAYRESSFTVGDFCHISISKDRIVSREQLTSRVEGDDRERLCFSYSENRTSCQIVLIEDETQEDRIVINRCAAGEVGLFQLISRETRAGTIVPATGIELPEGTRARRNMVLDPQVNTSLGAATLRNVRDACCGEDEECKKDWTRWVGGHNTGTCHGHQFNQYGRKISQHWRRGMRYVCEQAPESDACISYRNLTESEEQ